MKLKDLLNCMSKNTVVRIALDFEWLFDTNTCNSDVLKPYYNHCIHMVGIDENKIFIGLVSETGGIS
jgi:hypothetical protein